MKKVLQTIFIVLTCLLTLSSFVFAEVSLGDIQKVVREENKNTLDQCQKQVDEAKKSITDESISFANRVMGDFLKVIEEAEKKVILVASITIVGLILLVEGVIGFIRIKREQNLILLLKKDVDLLNTNFNNVIVSYKSINTSLLDTTKRLKELDETLKLNFEKVKKQVKEEIVEIEDPKEVEEVKSSSFVRRLKKKKVREAIDLAKERGVSDVRLKDYEIYLNEKYGLNTKEPESETGE